MTRKTVWKIALRWTIEQNNTPCVGFEQVSQPVPVPTQGGAFCLCAVFYDFFRSFFCWSSKYSRPQTHIASRIGKTV